jgi:hemerythrin superfamily protein
MTGTTGQQDVVDVLTTDHHEVLELIGQMSATTDAERRRDMADTVIAELMRHSVAEEMYVYPAMREHLPGGQEMVEHDVEEHQELEEAMKELEGIDASEPRFLEALGRLEAILRDHVQDEENDQFPLLRAQIPAEQLVELGSKVETAKKAAPTRPHPSAPHSALFHKTVGPGVGLVDRLRDTLTGRSKNT